MMNVVGDNAPKRGVPVTNPLMHRTRTVDYAIIMSGEIDMMLDDKTVHLKSGDVVVQQATNHAWLNHGKEPCRTFCVDGFQAAVAALPRPLLYAFSTAPTRSSSDARVQMMQPGGIRNMPRNDRKDLQPPIRYKERRLARPLTRGEIKAAVDRAEARAMQTQLADDRANSNVTKPG